MGAVIKNEHFSGCLIILNKKKRFDNEICTSIAFSLHIKHIGNE